MNEKVVNGVDNSRATTIGASAGKCRANCASRLRSIAALNVVYSFGQLRRVESIHREKESPTRERHNLGGVSLPVARIVSGVFQRRERHEESRCRRLGHRVLPHAGVNIPGLVEPVVRRRGAVGTDVTFETQVEPDVAYRWRERQDFACPTAVTYVGRKQVHGVARARIGEYPWGTNLRCVLELYANDGSVLNQELPNLRLEPDLAAGLLDNRDERIREPLAPPMG
jgi:hypothetical protein